MTRADGNGLSSHGVRCLSAAVAVFASACSLPSPPRKLPVHAWFADELDLAPVRRIVVLPFSSSPGVLADEQLVRTTFTSELAKTHRFRLLSLPEAAPEDDMIIEAARRGTLSIEAMVALGRRYDIDGILLGEITAYRPYQPPQLGLHMQLLSMHSASVVWATECIYDTADARVQEDIKHFAASFLAKDESMHEWRINMLSPRKFATYVAHRLATTWQGV